MSYWSMVACGPARSNAGWAIMFVSGNTLLPPMIRTRRPGLCCGSVVGSQQALQEIVVESKFAVWVPYDYNILMDHLAEAVADECKALLVGDGWLPMPPKYLVRHEHHGRNVPHAGKCFCYVSDGSFSSIRVREAKWPPYHHHAGLVRWNLELPGHLVDPVPDPALHARVVRRTVHSAIPVLLATC